MKLETSHFAISLLPLFSHLATSLLSHLSHLPTSLPSHLSQLATSLPSQLSNLASLLSSHIFHLATSTPSHFFPPSQINTLPPFATFSNHYSPTFPSSLPIAMTNRVLQNTNVFPLGIQVKHVWLIVRKLHWKASCWVALLALQDLGKAISMALIMGGSLFCFHWKPLAVKFLPYLPTPDSVFQMGSCPADFHTGTTNNCH